jgi:teichuronic acid biosynthesis protein TuaE
MNPLVGRSHLSFPTQCVFEALFASLVVGVAISYGKLYLFHLSLGVVVLVLAFKGIDRRRIASGGVQSFFPVFMFCWYGLSLVWARNRALGLTYLFYIGIGIAIVWMSRYSMSTKENQGRVFRMVAAVFIVEMAFCLLEMTGRFRLPISPYSRYVAYFGRDVTLADTHAAAWNVLRHVPTGFEWNPNNLATTMLIVFPFLLNHKSRLVRIVGSASILFIVLSAMSRANVLAYVLVVMAYLLLRKRAWSILAVVGLPGLVWLLSLLRVVRDSYVVRSVGDAMTASIAFLLSRGGIVGSSGSIRYRLIANGIEALFQSAGLGVGAGNSVWVQVQRGTVSGITSMHNFWVELLVEGGIVFFVLFVVWYVGLVISLLKCAQLTDDSDMRYYAVSCALSLIGFVVGAMSASTVIYLLPMWLLFGFSIATIENIRKNADGLPRKRRIRALEPSPSC